MRPQAREVLASDAFANDVRDAERYYQERGIHSVPAVIIDDMHLISGGQPPEVFERALRQIAATEAWRPRVTCSSAGECWSRYCRCP
jgi:predicted DsbA family dithiol-disulfide isomerase